MTIFVDDESDDNRVKDGDNPEKWRWADGQGKYFVSYEQREDGGGDGICPEIFLEQRHGQEKFYRSMGDEKQSPECMAGK
jgi:hypothetical protein